MSKDYKPTIGLEIHAELITNSKLFCSCINDPLEESPNKNICEICLGYPGAMPAVNEEAVKKMIKIGFALGGKIAGFSEFNRKHYFYPDIPKGYQITQFNHPIVSSAKLCGIDILRIHLEEDAASSRHTDVDTTLVDFNRSGIPLMELVTLPEFHDEDKVIEFAKELQLILQHIGISHARMQFGEMRVEVNISISKTEELGTKVELKNINSFRVVRDAILYEIERQKQVLQGGGKVIQETRGWDENKNETFSQRKKEVADEYRYIQEPDLSKLDLTLIDLDEIKNSISKLPEELRHIYIDKIGINKIVANTLVNNIDASRFLDEVIEKDNSKAKIAANYIANDILSFEEELGNGLFKKITPTNLIDIVNLINKNRLSSRGAKDLIKILLKDGGEAEKIMKDNNLEQEQNEEFVLELVKDVIKNNKTVAEEYKSGKEQSIQFLIGKVMQASKGKANPKVVLETLKANL